jgi:hypothetical protein
VASSSVRVGFENGDTIDIALTLKALNILAAMLWLVSAGLWALGAMVETRDTTLTRPSAEHQSAPRSFQIATIW